MTVTTFLTCSSKCYFMEQRNIVVNHSGFTDHDARSMIHHHTHSNVGCRMNIDSKNFTHSALQIEGKFLSIMPPEPMRHPVSRQGLISFQVQKGHQVIICCWVTLEHRLQIFSKCPLDFLIGLVTILDNLKKLFLVQSTAIKPYRQISR